MLHPHCGALTPLPALASHREHLARAQLHAEADQREAQERFRSWVVARVPAAKYMNVGSGAQVQQLLFAGVANKNPSKKPLELERVFKARQGERWCGAAMCCCCCCNVLLQARVRRAGQADEPNSWRHWLRDESTGTT